MSESAQTLSILTRLNHNIEYLSSWERDFVKSILRYISCDRPLSKKQYNCLIRIYKKKEIELPEVKAIPDEPGPPEVRRARFMDENGNIVAAVLKPAPDPKQNYRKSAKKWRG